MQIFENKKNKSTGNLSFTTSLLAAGGVYARLFTLLVNVDDFLILFSNIGFSIINTILLSQFYIYRNKLKVN